MSRVLDVYLQENLVGSLEQNTGGELIFTYEQAHVQTQSIAISLSLPLQTAPFTGPKVRAFFSGLLPEESVRERLAKTLGISKENSFALLEAVGGDCAGALAFYPHGSKPPKPTNDYEILDHLRLTEVLDIIKRRPMLAGDDGYRLSLAGAQDKLAVGFQDGHVLLIKGGSPTTHILKPIIERIQDSAHNELFCMQLAKRVGLDVPEASLHFVGDTPYYLVKRYDRQVDQSKKITRIHQEDFCQAMGISPEIKYESEGGPTLAICLQLIEEHFSRPAADQIKFLTIVLFNFLIGNADAHGKNFSLLYKDNKPELAPAYDLLSTVIYPDLTEKMAMKIGGKYKPSDISMKHFFQLVPNTKPAHSAMTRMIKTLIDKITDEAPTLKAKLYGDGLKSDVYDKIITTIQKRSKRLK